VLRWKFTVAVLCICGPSSPTGGC